VAEQRHAEPEPPLVMEHTGVEHAPDLSVPSPVAATAPMKLDGRRPCVADLQLELQQLKPARGPKNDSCGNLGSRGSDCRRLRTATGKASSGNLCRCPRAPQVFEASSEELKG
jgi:hypothetical protein